MTPVRVQPVLGVAGLMLTGGSSRRMGRDKASISIAGRPCAEVVGGYLSRAVAPAFEVGPGRSGLPVVREEIPGRGPLSAVVAGWRALTAEGHRGPVVVLACDLPKVSERLLAFLASHPAAGSIVPVVHGRSQPLCSRFSAAALDHGERVVEAGRRSMAALLEYSDVTWLHESRWSKVADAANFEDIDTPADLARLGLAPG